MMTYPNENKTRQNYCSLLLNTSLRGCHESIAVQYECMCFIGTLILIKEKDKEPNHIPVWRSLRYHGSKLWEGDFPIGQSEERCRTKWRVMGVEAMRFTVGEKNRGWIDR